MTFALIVFVRNRNGYSSEVVIEWGGFNSSQKVLHKIKQRKSFWQHKSQVKSIGTWMNAWMNEWMNELINLAID